jgi:hypothetical protein
MDGPPRVDSDHQSQHQSKIGEEVKIKRFPGRERRPEQGHQI